LLTLQSEGGHSNRHCNFALTFYPAVLLIPFNNHTAVALQDSCTSSGYSSHCKASPAQTNVPSFSIFLLCDEWMSFLLASHISNILLIECLRSNSKFQPSSMTVGGAGAIQHKSDVGGLRREDWALTLPHRLPGNHAQHEHGRHRLWYSPPPLPNQFFVPCAAELRQEIGNIKDTAVDL
jgi:hypothetical protein